MGDFGLVVLVIFIIIRILIAGGLFYLIVSEVRRYKKRRVKDTKETDEDVNGKGADGSSGSRG